MGTFFSSEIVNGSIKVLTFDRKDIDSNVLSKGVLREFDQILDECKTTGGTTGLVIRSGKSGQFIAGADIKEIERFSTAAEAQAGAAQMQAIFTKLSNLPIPTVAAIHGACLGGGLELSLACKFRVASDSDSTALGLPEIQLGLIPGAGGTQRLPRLIGIQTALDMILTGKRLKGKKALKVGLVDAMVHQNLLTKIAVEFAEGKRKHHPRNTGLGSAVLEGNPLGRMIMEKKARDLVTKNTKGFYPAAYKALEAVFKGISTTIDKGLIIEAKCFGELAMTRQSNSLIHLFHATTHLKKHDYKQAEEQRFGKEKPSLVGVIGSGFMGAGIATVCADKGIRVRISDPNKEAIGRAYQHIRKFFAKKLKRKQIKPFELDQKLNHISADTSPTGFKSCDVVIEAVFEDLKLKQNLLANCEKSIGPDWIFASNTSAIPIKDIAVNSINKERIIGMHFFSPVEKMPLLEVIKTPETADWVCGRVVSLGQDLGKQVIVVEDGPGFYTTRALAFFLNEASLILGEGAAIDQIDKALNAFGFPVGPITLIDEVGIDVGSHVLSTMSTAFPDRISMPESIQHILDSGRLGRKNKKGFYTYQGDKKGAPDSEIYKIVHKNPPTSKISSDEIVDRCLLVFVNESIRCLEEGILHHAYDGDVGAVFGLGFPPFWGGPFKYVDHLSAQVVHERMTRLAEKYGNRFQPADTLTRYAEQNLTFFPDESKSDNET